MDVLEHISGLPGVPGIQLPSSFVPSEVGASALVVPECIDVLEEECRPPDLWAFLHLILESPYFDRKAVIGSQTVRL